MSSVQIHTEITSSPLNLTAIRQWVGDPAAGAVVTFEGVVRDHDHGVGVTGITYSAHPSATDTLARVVAHFAECEGIRAIAVEHRVGQLIVATSPWRWRWQVSIEGRPSRVRWRLLTQ